MFNAEIIRTVTDNITVTKTMTMKKIDYFRLHEMDARKLITGSMVRNSNEDPTVTDRVLSLLENMFKADINFSK